MVGERENVTLRDDGVESEGGGRESERKRELVRVLVVSWWWGGEVGGSV